ncbi:hypothetical protein DSCA_16000 [Desulfosarcina alkanivorans]|uniref:N-acetyltransferase domain-containing protein n=1 Tax=Desulfosarcina alkanivorans TaxID=571177 RepID=A0A5K7YHV4_9BACT|nr:GNAT family N-acetyltransferase [Desulfosarcina alkanivorans]BBO67670.1 hypothetical protein DSCA_16000 [Desulfosarcina alkanivorans]
MVPFENRPAAASGRLNRDWLDHFSLREAADDRHLDAPRESIIARNGQIVFAVEGDDVLGTCAAIPHGNGVFEMAKLAVAPSARGKGIGRQLARGGDRLRQECRRAESGPGGQPPAGHSAEALGTHGVRPPPSRGPQLCDRRRLHGV